jgi:predicted nucleic acid-binding protein
LRANEVPDGPLLLDTTAFSHLLRGGVIADQLTELTADHEVVVSFVTVGEVIAGAAIGGWGQPKLALLELKLAACGKAVGSERVAREYGRLKARFRSSKGDNDLWIAACSLAETTALPIVTTDTDFDEIGSEFDIAIVRPD